MVSVVITIHATMAFGNMGWWHGIRIPIEGSGDPFFPVASRLFFYFCNTFFMYILLLISGYFVPGSIHKKGIEHYLRDRPMRIGITFMVGMLLINNASYLLARLLPASP